jgi:pimeloyl-ACP methyl ester carboxylesterase
VICLVPQKLASFHARITLLPQRLDGFAGESQLAMTRYRKIRPFLVLAGLALACYALVLAVVYFQQRSMLFFPTHTTRSTTLSRWEYEGQIIGSCREVAQPNTVWLMAHGNAGQSSDRSYVLARMDSQDSLYVLEYPGYGGRTGEPAKQTMDAALQRAYALLCVSHPHIPIGVIGESIGSGPASTLAQALPRPAKIILVVPFDTLASVAAERMPFIPVRLLLKDDWDNEAALKAYPGPLDIYGAIDDRVIPFAHAKGLAASLPQAHFTAIPGGHNDWSLNPQVRLTR